MKMIHLVQQKINFKCYLYYDDVAHQFCTVRTPNREALIQSECASQSDNTAVLRHKAISDTAIHQDVFNIIVYYQETKSTWDLSQ